MKLPTASSLARAIACPASVVLPAVYGGGEDAERGSAIGRYVRDVLSGESCERAIAMVPHKAWQATCRALDWNEIQGDLTNVRAEVAYAIDPAEQTCRELGQNLARQYPETSATEYVGTNDLEGRFGDIEVACDLKSGREVTACANNPQMTFHAAARWLRTGRQIESRLLYIREDGRVFRDAHRFGAFELESFCDSLVDLYDRLTEALAANCRRETLAVYTGAHCKYCPALQACPAYNGLARTMARDIDVMTASAAMMTREEGGVAWTKMLQWTALLKSARKILESRARQEPLVTRPGKIVKEISFSRSALDTAAALELLRSKGASQEEIAALYTSKEVSQVREVNDK